MLRIYNPTNTWYEKKMFFTGLASAMRNNLGDVTVIKAAQKL